MSDTLHDEAERLRRRQGQIDDDAATNRGLESRPACVVASVVSGSGSTGTFFTLEIMTVTGTEADGSDGTLTPTGIRIKAVNLGGTTPPLNTKVIAHRTSYRWAFRYG